MLLYGNNSFRTKRRLLIFFYTCEVFTFPNRKALNQNGCQSVPCEEPHPKSLVISNWLMLV